MEITYKHYLADKIPLVFKFEPTIVGVTIVNTEDYVFVSHKIEPIKISIIVSKHCGKEQRATLSWFDMDTQDGGDVEFADKFHHCLETAILIASLINAHYKKGN